MLRRAAAEDAAAVRALTRAAYAKWVPLIGREPKPMRADYARAVREHRIDLALLADELAGLIETIEQPDHLLIENVAVDPRRQGEGIGRALLDFAADYAREHRRPVLRLYTNAAMTENIAFYTRLGYRELDRRTENGFQRVFFDKRL